MTKVEGTARIKVSDLGGLSSGTQRQHGRGRGAGSAGENLGKEIVTIMEIVPCFCK